LAALQNVKNHRTSVLFTPRICPVGLAAIPEPASIPAGVLQGIVGSWQASVAVVCAHLYPPNPHLKPLLADFRKQDSEKTETDGQGLIALRALRSPDRARWHGHDRAGCCSGTVLWSYRRMVQAQCSYCMNDTGARSFPLNLGPPCFLSGCDPCPSFWADRPLACGFTVVSPDRASRGLGG
jgi:hypothetical protein